MSTELRPRPRSTWPLWIAAACVYLALAPLGEEPHLVGKLRWVAGGAVGMGPIDWLDLALHGLPLLGFAVWGLLRVLRKRDKPAAGS